MKKSFRQLTDIISRFEKEYEEERMENPLYRMKMIFKSQEFKKMFRTKNDEKSKSKKRFLDKLEFAKNVLRKQSRSESADNLRSMDKLACKGSLYSTLVNEEKLFFEEHNNSLKDNDGYI